VLAYLGCIGKEAVKRLSGSVISAGWCQCLFTPGVAPGLQKICSMFKGSLDMS